MKKFWLIIFSVSLAVLFAAGETEHINGEAVPQQEETLSDVGILYDAFAGRQMVAREFLNDALQASSNVVCQIRNYNYNSHKVSDLRILLRFAPNKYLADYGRYRVSCIGMVSGSQVSDYVTSILRRINI